MIETPVAQPDAPAPAGTPRSRLTSRLVRAAYIAALVLGDILAIGVAFVFAYELRALTERRPDQVPSLAEYLPTLAFLVVSLIATFALTRMYLPRRGRSHID